MNGLSAWLIRLAADNGWAMTISFFVRHHDFRSPDLCAQIVIWTQLIDDAVEKLLLTLMPRQSATTITSGLGRHRLI